MISGVILSGGRSSRLGREKGLAMLNGRPLVSHVIGAIEGLVDELLISVATGMRDDYREFLGEGLRIVEDVRTAFGPVEGLVSSFRIATGEYVIVSPCDTPLLKTSVCKLVLEKAHGTDGAVPVIRGYFEPLHAVYRRRAGLRAFETSLSEGKRRVTDAYEMLDLVRVEESVLKRIDPRLDSFWNINTERDILEAEKRLSKPSP